MPPPAVLTVPPPLPALPAAADARARAALVLRPAPARALRPTASTPSACSACRRATSGRPTRAEPGLSGAELGTVVHDLLERAAAATAPTRRCDAPPARDARPTRARATSCVARWERSELAQLARDARAAPRGAVPGRDRGRRVAGRLDLVGRGRTARPTWSTTRRTASSGRAPAETPRRGLRPPGGRLRARAARRQGHDRGRGALRVPRRAGGRQRTSTRGRRGRLAGARRGRGARRAHGPYVPRPGVACLGAPCSACSAPGPTSTRSMPRLTPDSARPSGRAPRRRAPPARRPTPTR